MIKNLYYKTLNTLHYITSDKKVKRIIESINDVEAKEEISNFTLNNGLLLKNNFIDTIIIGTNKKDVIIGSSEGEVIAGLENKDVLKGGEGADGFLFNTNEFGNKKADLIRDFDPDEGDSIFVKQDTYNMYRKIEIKSVNGRSKSKRAAKSKNNFILVTSSIKGEGKTVVSVNLASMLSSNQYI